MPDSTDQFKPVTLTSEIGGDTLHGVTMDVNDEPQQIGYGDAAYIFIQCPNTDSSGANNNASVFYGTSRFQQMELVPGQYSPKLECRDLRQIWVRVGLPVEPDPQIILNIPFIGKKSRGERVDEG